MKLSLGICLLLSLGALGCRHKNSIESPSSPAFLSGADTQQMTFLGQNEHPRFSPDASKIIYQSRRSNKGWQIYEMNLDSRQERRVTFSDGDAFDATYISNNEILYASTTDEIKEGPLVNRMIDKDYPPSEIYRSDLYGTNIVRLTQRPAYDAEIAYQGSLQRFFIYFTSHREEILGIYKLDSTKSTVNLISAEKGKIKKSPTLSPDQSHLAWLEKDLNSGVQSVVLYDLKKKVSRTIKSTEGDIQNILFAPRPPARLFYSVLRKNSQNNLLEVYSLENNCTQTVLTSGDSLFSPSVSDSSPEKLAYVRQIQDRTQIYVATLPSDLGPCLETTGQATLKE